ncbi:glycyl-radical enzyme activating protein [Spirochaetia bacterium]|nr:glycyl-radical enzyme activating protein [Spirochaetia bacterium]
MNELSAVIMDIDHFAVHDGPGIRTSIFFKGCPLRCAWCHSPESQSALPQVLYTAARCICCGKCVGVCPKKLHRVDREGHVFSQDECDSCGICVKACPRNALNMGGKERPLEEVLEEAVSDEVFFRHSGGGVTLTGGEVLMQGAFVTRLLSEIKKRDIHTIVETSGSGSTEYLLSFADSASLFYYDFKLADPDKFRSYIGPNPDLIWNNLEQLRRKTASIVLRLPLIPAITDNEENITALYKLAGELKLSHVHLLPYNYSAGAKYEWLGKAYPLVHLEKAVQSPEEFLKLDHGNITVEIIK